MPTNKTKAPLPPTPTYLPSVVLSKAALSEVVTAYDRFDYIVFDVETVGGRPPREGGRKGADIPALDERTNTVLWIALAGPGRVDIIPMGHPSLPDHPAPQQLTRFEVLSALQPLFFSDRSKVNQNVLFDTLSLAKYWGEIPPGPYSDLISIVHLLNENLQAYDLGSLAERYTGFTYRKLAKEGAIDSHPFWDVARYVGLDAKLTQLIWGALDPMYERPGLEKLAKIRQMESDITEVLIHTKAHGALVDRDGFERVNHFLSVELGSTEEQIFEAIKDQLASDAWPEHKFLITSTQQKAKLLYGPPEKGGLALGCRVTTDKGAQSTSEKALKPLTRKHPVVPLLLRHAELSKLRGTYTTGFTPHIADDNRIRAGFKQSGTATGRFSSSRPNCFSSDTEVLTPRGWVVFPELRTTDLVAQWEDGAISFVAPTARVSYPYIGDMIRLQSSAWDVLVTPDHRLLSWTRAGTKCVEPAENWLDWGAERTIERWGAARMIDRKVARGGHRVGGSDDVANLHLAVLVQADGSWVPWAGGYWDCAVKSHRKKEQFRMFWPERLRARGEQRLTLRVTQGEVDRWLDPATKTFRIEELLKLSESALEQFLGWVMLWDGDSTRGLTFGQRPERSLAVEAVQLAAVLTGRSTAWYTKSDAFQVVNVHRESIRYVSNVQVTRQPYNGKVWCVSVPSEFLLTRRSHDVLVVGNCQNLPRQTETEADQQIRRLFIAPLGCVLVVGDFGQIEYRCMAHFAGPLVRSSRMVKAFRDHIDLHAMTASGLYDLAPGEVSKEQRQDGKVTNFCLMFGGGPNRLLESGMVATKRRADQVFQVFHQTYPEVEIFTKKVVEQCRNMEHPYVETLWGRRRRLPGITAPLITRDARRLRAYAERQAVNHIVQGSAADINKSAMVRVFRRINRTGYKMHLTLTVHDEIVLEVPEVLAEEGVSLLRDAMEGVKANLLVPLVADVHYGATWADAK